MSETFRVIEDELTHVSREKLEEYADGLATAYVEAKRTIADLLLINEHQMKALTNVQIIAAVEAEITPPDDMSDSHENTISRLVTALVAIEVEAEAALRGTAPAPE